MVSKLIILASLLLVVACAPAGELPAEPVPEPAPETEYTAVIDPSNFDSVVSHPYFNLTPGKRWVYETRTEEGLERNEVLVTNDAKIVLGVSVVVVWDRVWLNDVLIEDTKDWFAQDKEGNVWYMGEDSKEFANGVVVSTKGSWEPGIDGAQAGIIMKANPVVGEEYRQEYYKGEAEDWGEVLALQETVSVPYGTFTNCIKTRDWTPLEPDVEANKYYCAQVGNVVLEVEGGERVELINVTLEENPEIPPAQESAKLKANITEEDAKEIALKEVPGRVTDVAIEFKLGKLAYVVEIRADEGPETDVIIDIETGGVLGIET